MNQDISSIGKEPFRYSCGENASANAERPGSLTQPLLAGSLDNRKRPGRDWRLRHGGQPPTKRNASDQNRVGNLAKETPMEGSWAS